MKKRLILWMVLLIMLSFNLYSQVEKIDPKLYNTVWEREFLNYTSDKISYYLLDTGEVVVSQYYKVDKNNEHRDLIDLKKDMLFYSGKEIKKEYFENKLRKRIVIPKTTEESYNVSSGEKEKEYSKIVYDNLGNKYRWVNGLAVYYDKRYEDNKKYIIDKIAINRSRINGTYFSDLKRFSSVLDKCVIVLEKLNENNKILWQKVYFYNLPIWRSYFDRAEIEYDYYFYYLRRGYITLLNADNIFLNFPGTKMIYRVDKNGNPVTQDKNVIVLDYKNYVKFYESEYNRLNIKYLMEDEEGVDFNPIDYEVFDYDYIGERLLKKYKFNLNDKKIIDSINEHPSVKHLMKIYKLMDEYYKKEVGIDKNNFYPVFLERRWNLSVIETEKWSEK
ncbi:hypothetical protein [Haliovirga abyssi]|uniref:YARHG domain-containing protein n=1 Tax=Haliovirga abyssi TaxID=2996794 RepID=A0AAU9D255_9FUSO|nr:hypothetical protein [Haliovirga abyssi]BDU50074.1 hypothetical protein HLVA_06430 [Haliovirga abyssi]